MWSVYSESTIVLVRFVVNTPPRATKYPFFDIFFDRTNQYWIAQIKKHRISVCVQYCMLPPRSISDVIHWHCHWQKNQRNYAPSDIHDNSCWLTCVLGCLMLPHTPLSTLSANRSLSSLIMQTNVCLHTQIHTTCYLLALEGVLTFPLK